MNFETPNLGKQYKLAEAQIRNGQEIDMSHLSNDSLLFYLNEAVIKSEVANEIVHLMLNEVEARGLLDESR